MAANVGGFRSLVVQPKSFDGSETLYPVWKRQVKLYVLANEAQLTTDQAKYMVALSFMQDGKAARWANMISDRIIDGTYGTMTGPPAQAGGNPTFARYTWAQFWTQADVVFNPPNTQNDAA